MSEEEKASGPKAFGKSAKDRIKDLLTIPDDSLEWNEVIPWLRANTKMEIWLKGGKIHIFGNLLAALNVCSDESQGRGACDRTWR